MPLARLAQYQHCLLRRNGVRTTWGHSGSIATTAEQMGKLRLLWQARDFDILDEASAADQSS